MDSSPNLGLPYIAAAQAQKHVTHNEALRVLDALVQLSVADIADTPPVAAEPGARHIVGPAPTGAWAGQAGAVALWDDGAWQFFAPQPGWRAWRRDTAQTVVFDGTAWLAQGGLSGAVPQLGVNTSADAVNRLAVASDASLFSHDGAGHQIKLNKAGAGETASLLFQTGWSGRAEMGTAGADDFAIKVSADGAAWQTALSVMAASGVPDLAAGATIGGQAAYHRGNLLGAVSQAAGQPTGAVFERGSAGGGDYVRFADGTQICTIEIAGVDTDTVAGAIYRGTPTAVDFPVPFLPGSVVTGTGSSVNTGLLWVNGRATSSTQWSYTTFSPAARTGDVIALMAIGRWV